MQQEAEEDPEQAQNFGDRACCRRCAAEGYWKTHPLKSDVRFTLSLVVLLLVERAATAFESKGFPLNVPKRCRRAPNTTSDTLNAGGLL